MVPTIMEGPESWQDNGTEIKYLKKKCKKKGHDKNEYSTQKHRLINLESFFQLNVDSSDHCMKLVSAVLYYSSKLQILPQNIKNTSVDQKMSQ